MGHERNGRSPDTAMKATPSSLIESDTDLMPCMDGPCRPELFAAREYGPGDARGRLLLSDLRMPDDRHGAIDQPPAQIGIAALAVTGPIPGMLASLRPAAAGLHRQRWRATGFLADQDGGVVLVPPDLGLDVLRWQQADRVAGPRRASSGVLSRRLSLPPDIRGCWDEPPSGLDRPSCRPRPSCRRHVGPGRLAQGRWQAAPTTQRQPAGAAPLFARALIRFAAQASQECLTVPPPKLSEQPRVRQLHRYRQCMLRRLECTHRRPRSDHLNHNPGMDPGQNSGRPVSDLVSCPRRSLPLQRTQGISRPLKTKSWCPDSDTGR